MIMENLRVALVGAGGIAQSYLDVVAAKNAEIDIVAIVEPDETRGAAALAKVPTKLFPDVHSMLDARESLGIQGVMVCTPPITHVPIATTILELGIPVLCEKPLAPNRPGLCMMNDAAAKTDTMLMMASKFRYVDDVARTKELIDTGALGEIVLFRNAFTSPVDMSQRWNSKRDISGGGVIIDNGTHSVDIARYLLGAIRYVIATETRRVQGLSVEETAQVMFRTDSNAIGTIDLSWSLSTGSQWYVTVDGTAGSVRLGWQTAEINTGDGWTTFGSGYNKQVAFSRQLNDFADAIRHDKAPVISADDAQASVAVVDAAYRSMETGAWVRVVEERRAMERS
jgi:predicted dehydrogenase